MSTLAPPRPRRLPGRKIRAVLAGGLVLGIGAAVVAAAWNDSEFGTGGFNAGHFDLLGSIDGTTFTDYPAATPAALTFSVPVDDLAPGDVVAASFVLHLSATTTDAATLTVASAVGLGTAAAEFSYGIIQVGSVAACTATAVGTTIVAAGTPLSSVGTPVPTTLAQSIDGIAPGADVFTCVQVTASATLAQDTASVGTWEFGPFTLRRF